MNLKGVTITVQSGSLQETDGMLKVDDLKKVRNRDF